MVDADPLGRAIDRQHCTRIAQVSHVTHLPHTLLPNKGQTASATSITCAHQFQLVVCLGESPCNHSPHVTLFPIQLFLEDLRAYEGTFGSTCEEYSET